MSMRAPIARARGLGSAHEGVSHWKAQRLTAVANVVLVLWFVFSAATLSGAGYEEVRAWLRSPVSATLMILLAISVFYHAKLGVQVVIEDYVHHEGLKVASLTALTLATCALGAVCVVSVLMVALGS
ncbi:succinate dehydrogenase, hydrophobic membrane anchor protein [Marinivivus vitaminiproducens]|uniref:succinate dehydrogenase, hydrophobic membrane anchor protein n=1 Tax=Marinivivus vitaminiproducens TaxID=3035935 RepID=UPI0027A1A97F|nr:succinate dehydrogenase, hydrophobic membrane anchor protein [Geminicoccaceae bacterium SCSIO 64248]